jgi:hypothetical protein
MPELAIENPIINSPFTEPTNHFRFDWTVEIMQQFPATRGVYAYVGLFDQTSSPDALPGVTPTGP